MLGRFGLAQTFWRRPGFVVGTQVHSPPSSPILANWRERGVCLVLAQPDLGRAPGAWVLGCFGRLPLHLALFLLLSTTIHPSLPPASISISINTRRTLPRPTVHRRPPRVLLASIRTSPSPTVKLQGRKRETRRFARRHRIFFQRRTIQPHLTRSIARPHTHAHAPTRDSYQPDILRLAHSPLLNPAICSLVALTFDRKGKKKEKHHKKKHNFVDGQESV